MKNKELILNRLDAIIKSYETENNKSKLAQKDLHAFKTLRRQYIIEDIAGIKHSADNWFETATREMLPMECGELMGFEPLHEPIIESQTEDDVTPEQAKEEAMNTELTVGTKVIIRWNPHHPHVKDILGEIIEFRPRAGFGGEDMVGIGYYDDATYYQRPLATKFVDAVTRESLLEAAKHHERMAKEAREMAEEV